MEGPEDYCLHEHPLIYNKDQQEDWCCSACGLPLLLSPSYRCSNYTCNFFLHKACKQLPQGLNYDGEYHKLSLSLAVKPPNEEWTCHVCGELCENLIAYRGTLLYAFALKVEHTIVHVDVLCAPVTLEIKSKHDSHKHELVAMRRKALLLCDVCERPHKGFFFSCKEHSCVFWIHKDCAVLPRVVETIFHDHPLVFSYFHLETLCQGFPAISLKCIFCKEQLSGSAAYYCMVCSGVAHSNCVISNIKNSENDPPVQFPLEEAEKSFFIYKMLDKKRLVEKNNDEDEKSSIEKYHKHRLIFHDIVDKDSSSNSLCDACILPINSPPYYSCEKPRCDFLLHQHCTNLPSKINLADRVFILKPKADELLPSSFNCQYGCHWCTGFAYYPGRVVSKADLECFSSPSADRNIDLECASAPRTIKHQLHHTQHILYLISVRGFKSLAFACCSDESDHSYSIVYAYQCVSCNFMIHSRCAFLPSKVSHKFDKHPLQLSNGVNVNGEYPFCEICEGHVDTKYWSYHCKECDQFFHVNCLPSVGVWSKVKFGGTYISPCHHHPVFHSNARNRKPKVLEMQGCHTRVCGCSSFPMLGVL